MSVRPPVTETEGPLVYAVGGGLAFRREDDGSVIVTRTFDMAGTKRIIRLTALDPLAWVGLVAAMSPDKDSADRWNAAKVLHMATGEETG